VTGLPLAPIRGFRQVIAYESYDEVTGPPEATPIEIVRNSDVVSPELYGFLANGVVIPEVEIVLADGAFSVTLEEAMVVEMGGEGTQGDLPLERLAIAYRDITWTVVEGGIVAHYDVFTHEGGGPFWGEESFVHPGSGVSAGPDALLFSELTSGIFVPFANDVPTGRARLEPLGLVTRAGAPTLAHLGAITGNAISPSFEARFTGLGEHGTPIDRFAYRLESARVTSVRLETEPDGTLTESFDVMGQRIEWTGWGSDGQPVSQSWTRDQSY